VFKGTGVVLSYRGAGVVQECTGIGVEQRYTRPGLGRTRLYGFISNKGEQEYINGTGVVQGIRSSKRYTYASVVYGCTGAGVEYLYTCAGVV
jgi:hypothetical protein